MRSAHEKKKTVNDFTFVQIFLNTNGIYKTPLSMYNQYASCQIIKFGMMHTGYMHHAKFYNLA